MKATKRTPVPLPGSKAKPKARDTPSKTPLSQEFIDSDDDSAHEKTPQLKVAKKPKTTITIHKPNGVIKPKSKASTEENATPKPTLKSEVSPKKPAPKQIVTHEQVAELSSSEQTDDSDVPTRDTQTKLLGKEAEQDASDANDSDSSSDSSASSSSDEPEMNEGSQLNHKPAQEHARPSNLQSHAVEFQPAQSYVPPRGFNPVPLNDRTTSKAASIFDNLEGKEVWHITAPPGVSLQGLKELAMDKAVDGTALLSHKGTDYGFSKTEKSEEGTREILVPQKDGYKPVPARISQTMHLQAVVRLPKLTSKQADQNTGSEAAASITRSTIRAPRAQIKGLKMRFLPTGFAGEGTGTLGDSDSETEVARETAGLGMPDGLNLPSRKEKRKHADVNGVETTASPSKKSKKYRLPEEVQRKEGRRAKKEKKRAQEAALAIS